MKQTGIGSGLIFGVTLVIAAVLGTFILALASSSTQRIPGMVEVVVESGADDASVTVSWGAGLIILFAVGFLLSRRNRATAPSPSQ